MICFACSPCPWRAGLYRIIDSDNVRFVNVQGQFYSAHSSMVYEEWRNTSVSAPEGEWPALWFRTPEP